MLIVACLHIVYFHNTFTPWTGSRFCWKSKVTMLPIWWANWKQFCQQNTCHLRVAMKRLRATKWNEQYVVVTNAWAGWASVELKGSRSVSNGGAHKQVVQSTLKSQGFVAFGERKVKPTRYSMHVFESFPLKCVEIKKSHCPRVNCMISFLFQCIFLCYFMLEKVWGGLFWVGTLLTDTHALKCKLSSLQVQWEQVKYPLHIPSQEWF